MKRRRNNIRRELYGDAGGKWRVELVQRIDGEEAKDLNARRHGLSHRNFIAEATNKGGRGKRNHAMVYSIIREEKVWTRTMARPLKRLNLPSELSFGAATIRRRI